MNPLIGGVLLSGRISVSERPDKMKDLQEMGGEIKTRANCILAQQKFATQLST